MFLQSKVINLTINPQPGGPGPCIYIPHWQGGQVIPQAPGFLFIAFYDTQGYGGGILTRLHTGATSLTSIPILSSHLHLWLSIDLFLSGFPSKVLHTCHLFHSCRMFRPFNPSWFDHYIWCRVHFMTFNTELPEPLGISWPDGRLINFQETLFCMELVEHRSEESNLKLQTPVWVTS
jgi:hypothetical protein